MVAWYWVLISLFVGVLLGVSLVSLLVFYKDE